MTEASFTATDQTDVDVDALRAKYAEERNKRLRTDGIDQFIEVKGDFKHFVEDPWCSPTSRAPLNDEVEIVIVGGGHGGLIQGAELRKAGFNSIRIIDKAGDFGGSWYWNRYPGLRCDTEAYIYMPLLEETGHIPSEKYTMGDEILENAVKIAKKYDLYRHALFQTQVTEARWDDQQRQWTVKTDLGDTIKCRYLILSAGSLNRPRLPGIPGIDTYLGHTFHTARWDYEYTGGSMKGGLDKLRDKRVAVIGTGATAVQIIPHLAASAKELYICQRTPSMIGPRNNRPTDVDWFKSQSPGWQKERQQNFTACVTGSPQAVDMVNDGWTILLSTIPSFVPSDKAQTDEAKLELLGEIADFRATNLIRERIDKEVSDRETAEALKPWFRYFCKRPTFSDEFFPIFNRSTVHLIDTKGLGVDRITEKGFVVRGVEYEVDCIIFATGFEVGTAYTRRAQFEIYGRDGETLTSHWKGPHGAKARTLHGFYSHGFPNCFHMMYHQKGATANVTEMLVFQTEFIAQVLKSMKGRGKNFIEPTQEAEKEWDAECTILRHRIIDFLAACTPSYYNGEGRVENGQLSNSYGRGFVAYKKKLEEWLGAGACAGVILK